MATPSGNAVKGASTRPLRYPVQLVVMFSDSATEHVESMALDSAISKSEATRTLVDLGIALDTFANEYDVPVARLLEAAEVAAIKASGAGASSTLVVE